MKAELSGLSEAFILTTGSKLLGNKEALTLFLPLIRGICFLPNEISKQALRLQMV